MGSSKISLKSAVDAMLDEHRCACDSEHPSPADAGDAARLRGLTEKIVYRDWTPLIRLHATAAYLQISAVVKNSTGEGSIRNNTRPVALCPRMSDGFVVDLIFELIKEFELHEAAENFLFDGRRVYFPHDTSGMPLQEVASLRSTQSPSAPQPTPPTSSPARIPPLSFTRDKEAEA